MSGVILGSCSLKIRRKHLAARLGWRRGSALRRSGRLAASPHQVVAAAAPNSCFRLLLYNWEKHAGRARLRRHASASLAERSVASPSGALQRSAWKNRATTAPSARNRQIIGLRLVPSASRRCRFPGINHQIANRASGPRHQPGLPSTPEAPFARWVKPVLAGGAEGRHHCSDQSGAILPAFPSARLRRLEAWLRAGEFRTRLPLNPLFYDAVMQQCVMRQTRCLSVRLVQAGSHHSFDLLLATV